MRLSVTSSATFLPQIGNLSSLECAYLLLAHGLQKVQLLPSIRLHPEGWLTTAPVAQRCPAVFDVNYGIAILRYYDRGRIFMSRTSHINLPLLDAILAEKTQDRRLISPCLKAGVLRRFSDIIHSPFTDCPHPKSFSLRRKDFPYRDCFSPLSPE